MPEKPVLSRTITLQSESGRIPFLADEIDARFLAIDITVLTRADIVGSANFERYVPRIWSGYWYLINNNSIKKYGAIEFKRQRIYENEFNNLAFGINNALFDAGVIFGLEMELSDLKAWYAGADFLAENADESNGLYLAQPLSELIIYIPVGVDIEVKISRQAYPDIVDVEPSSNPITGLDGELIETNPVKPLESANSDILEGVDRPPTLDDYVRDKGYITVADCAVSGATNTKQIVTESGLTPEEIIEQLLLDGAILQSDIDAILASNPTATDEDILNALIDGGTATNPEVSSAITTIKSRSPYPEDPTKKYSWFVIFREKIGTGCPNVWTVIRGFITTANVRTLSQVYQGTSEPTPSTINWGTVTRGDSPYSLPVGYAINTAFEPIVQCGEVKTFYRATLEPNVTSSTFRSSDTPKVVFWGQP